MTVREAERTTLADYEVMVRARQLEDLRQRSLLSFQAFQNARAFSSDRHGKPVIKTFKDLFDYEKEYNQIVNGEAVKKKEKQDLELLERVAEINKKAVRGKGEGVKWQEITK